jgi:hypothetical protein
MENQLWCGVEQLKSASDGVETAPDKARILKREYAPILRDKEPYDKQLMRENFD